VSLKYNNSEIKTHGVLALTQLKFLVDCDVVVVNYNAGSLLCDCIASVISEGAAHIIVVDNASVDGSTDALERANKNNPALTIIRNQRNLGFSKACNVGANVSAAKHILFLNPDSTLCPGSLQRMITTLDSAPKIGMVGGYLSNPDGTEQPGGRRVFPTPKRAFMRAFGLSRLARFFPAIFSDFLLHKDDLPNAPVVVEAISGACMLVKRDESYFLHCEDLDWCMRFRQKGWSVMFVPNAKIIHIWGACSRSRPFFVEWHKHHGMLRFYRKFFRHQYPGTLWIAVVIGVWIRFSLVASYYTMRLPLSKLGLLRA